MKILVIVNVAPWEGSLGLTAWRLSRAMVRQKHQLLGVYFRGEGVYTGLPGAITDGGATDLHAAWLDFANESATPLLLCSTDARRRMDTRPADRFRDAGLPEIVSLMAEADRVLSL